MTDTGDIQSLAVAVGEIRGQVREIVHSTNNISTKVDALGEKVLPLATQVVAFSKDVEELKRRMSILEQEKHERDGASNVIGTIVKSPALGWIVFVGGAIWAAITGKFQ